MVVFPKTGGPTRDASCAFPQRLLEGPIPLSNPRHSSAHTYTTGYVFSTTTGGGEGGGGGGGSLLSALFMPSD